MDSCPTWSKNLWRYLLSLYFDLNTWLGNSILNLKYLSTVFCNGFYILLHNLFLFQLCHNSSFDCNYSKWNGFYILLFYFSYVIPVLLIAIILNVPKWMETKYKWTPVESNSTNLTESEAEIEYKMEFEISELRDNPNYIHYYVNWTRLLTTGLIPMVMLIYFNFGIFRGIQVNIDL